MYRDLADAIEKLKEEGAENLSLDDENRLEEELNQMEIVGTHRFDSGTDPSDESTLYLLERKDGEKCYLVLSFGVYKDPRKSSIIDKLKEMSKE